LALAALALFLLPAAQDPESEICTKFNKCKTSEVKEKKECPDCGRSKIPGDYAFCTRCASKEKVCGRCGRPKTADQVKKKGSGDPDDAVKSIEAKNIRESLTFYASDELEGRCAGYPGNEKAIAFIRDNLKKWGLKPGNKEDYFQPFQIKGRNTHNVIGIVEGSDLKNEYVLAGAHCDHVGKDGQDNAGRSSNPSAPNDKIWNGADDNGSGSMTLMEVARAFGEGGLSPKRTVVFIWFNAEEFGLVGAKHYANNPVYPLDKTVAMINMDMVGRNPDKPYSVGCSGNVEQWRALINKANQGVDCPVNIGPGKGDRTDQGEFVRKGLATAGFFGGMHPDYHKQTDHVDLISFDKAAKCAKLVLKMVWELANTSSPPSK
jgi:hypothetical protein